MGWTRSTIALAATLGTWASGLLSPIVGTLADKYGPRWLMPTGLIIAGLAFFFLSGAHSVFQFYVAYIIGRAISNPVLIGIVPRTIAVNFFRRKRNIVVAISSTIRPVTGAINIMLFSLIANRSGWRIGFQYLGVLSFLLVIPLLWLLRRRPEDIGMLPDGLKPVVHVNSSRTEVTDPRQDQNVADLPEISWTVKEAFRTRTLWCIVFTACIGTVASSSVGFSLKPYLLEVSISQTQSAAVLSLGTVLALGNVGWGLLADHITPRRCLILALIIAASMDIFLVYVDTLPTAYAFAIIWGVSSGSIGSLEHMMLAQYYGRNSYGSILGSFGPLQTLALGLGPGLGALIRDVSGSYNMLFISMAFLYVSAVGLIFFAKEPKLPDRST